MTNDHLTTWFASLPAEQKPICEAVRKLVLALPDDVSEQFKWSRPCYATERGIFCYLQTTKKHATLGFPNGAALDDPDGLLEGTGKDMRHVKLRTLADAQRAGIKRLLEQAVAS